MGGDDHEDRYMIQNTLGYVGKHSTRVYILKWAYDGGQDYGGDGRLETDNKVDTTRRPNEGRGDLHV